MQTKIEGTTMPFLSVRLDAGEGFLAETGELYFMDPTISMRTYVAGGGKGLFGGFKKVVGGGTLFMTEYSAPEGPGEVHIAIKLPGQIVEQRNQGGRAMMVHRHGFVAGGLNNTLSATTMPGLRAGLFGGEGFVLQKVEGPDPFFVALSGEITTLTLAPGQTKVVHPGHIGMYDDSVTFAVRTIKGLANKMFGGDMFLVELTGPGRVWLQTMPLPVLAHALLPYLLTKS
jgi:uncharacterized protein (TIGR00266 family)